MNNDSRKIEEYQNFTEDLGSGVNLEMVYIPAGELMMNSRPVAGSHDNNKPPYKVIFKQGFFIGKYPITQAQRQAIMGNNCHPSEFKGADRPVEKVSWHHAQEFCYCLSRIVKKDYRLPSEAEWEYACRAGTKTKYHFGDDESKLRDYAWHGRDYDCYGEDKMFQRGFWPTETSPVGLKKPNPWGLYDMYGNVWEWCEDDYDDYERNNEYEGTLDGSARVNLEINIANYGNMAKVIRGGCWRSEAKYCCSSSRFAENSINDENNIGFRVAYNPSLTKLD